MSFELFLSMICTMRILTTPSKYLVTVLLSMSIVFSLYGFSVDDTPLCAHGSCDAFIIQPVESIWSNIGSKLVLDHKVQSARVQKEIRNILADKKKLYEILESAAPYIYFIHQKTLARKLPSEIALIPAIESEFNPNDRSNRGAAGLWQLMPVTARELGVKVKSNYDERRNVVSSTEAALAYFSDLKNDFHGNWDLAISAYNCGQGTVKHATRRAGSTNFWNLKLPAETKVYLPKLLAIAEIIKHPEKYGVKLPPVSNRPYFIQLVMNKPVVLSTIAKTTGTDIDTLHVLNPDYRGERSQPNKHGAYTLLVPVKDAAALKSKLAKSVIQTKIV